MSQRLQHPGIGRVREVVKIGDLKFHCRIDGKAGAPWIVFSNSLLTNLSMWDRDVAALSAQFRILRYDQRGHGETAIPDHDCSIDELADDVLALLDVFAIERATFIGVSMGAATGLCLAGRGDRRIARLIACDGLAVSPPDAAEVWQARLDLARSQGMGVLATATLARWFAPQTLDSKLPVVDRVRAMIEATPFDGFSACARALMQFDLTVLLAGITAPTLLLAGMHDRAIAAAMRGFQGQIAGAQFRDIAGAGHLPNLEQPEAFLQAVAPFLSTRQTPGEDAGSSPDLPWESQQEQIPSEP